jgi:hypothetical protein
MRKVALLILLLFISIKSRADTIDFWHFYYNDSIILKCNLNSWWDGNGGFTKMDSLPTVTVHIHNIYKDSLAFMYFCDYHIPIAHGYFFIKDDNEQLLYTIPATSNVISPHYEDKKTYMISKKIMSEYLKVFKLLTYKPSESDPIILKIYYSDYSRNEMFPNKKEKLLGTIKII